MKCPNCQTENLSDSHFCHKCATPLKDDQEEFATIKTIQSQSFDLSRGDQFAGRYEVIEKLGQGGMGTVYKVFDQKIKEVVALKLIKPEIGVNTKAIERFRNELKVARKIAHRNICRMFDLGEDGLIHFITMEYVAGEDLKRFIKRAGILTSGKAISIAKQVSQGLAEAHRLDVIHRDLKPQNIMIDQDGNSRIMDFGIARFVHTDRLTGSGVMIGTPEYMSPEQAELKDVDKRADIYALGVVLYEMVTGQVPFEGETPLSIAMKHKTETPRNVRDLNSLVTTDLAEIISKCLKKDPNQRYQTAEELIHDLNQVEQGLSTQERVVPKKDSISTREITVSFPLKKLFLPAAAVLLVAIALVVALKFLPMKSGSDPPAPGEDQLTEQAVEGQAVRQGAETATDQETPPPGDAKKTAPPATKPKPKTTVSKKEPSRPVKSKAAPAPEIDERSAQLSMARMNAAKIQAQRKGLDEKDLFYMVANAKRAEAEKFMAQKNHYEAKSLAMVTERLFRIGIERSKDDQRFKALKQHVERLRKEVEKESESMRQSELFKYAERYEQQGAEFLANTSNEACVKAYAQAAVFFEKILLDIESQKDK